MNVNSGNHKYYWYVVVSEVLSVEVLKINMTKRHPESSAPDGELLDVEDCWFLWRQDQHDVLTRQEPLQPDLWLQVAPGDVGDDDAIRPEVDIWSLTVVCEVLDVDCLLV